MRVFPVEFTVDRAKLASAPMMDAVVGELDCSLITKRERNPELRPPPGAMFHLRAFPWGILLHCAVRADLAAGKSRLEWLELLYRYLSGVEFRQRVEAVVEAFHRMRDDLDQERRATERQWAKRSKQIEAVTFNIAGMYGDLQGLVPALPPIERLELPEADAVDGTTDEGASGQITH